MSVYEGFVEDLASQDESRYMLDGTFELIK